MNFLTNFWFVQSIGGIALFFAICAWNAETRKRVLDLQTISIIFFIIHYLLLGAFTGAASNGVGAVRNLVFIQKNKKKWASSSFWMYFFMALSALVLGFFWQGWPSILPVLGIMIGTYALFRDDPKHMRFHMFLTGLVWIPYTIIVHSYSGLITQVISTIGLGVAMFRLDRVKK